MSWEVWLKVLLFGLMVVALAKPLVYDTRPNTDKKGRDLILAIDASGSMAQRGFDEKERFKTKYETTLSLSQDFIAQRMDDNMGLVVFGTFAYTASPLTYDLPSLASLLEMTEVGIAGESTAIGEAIVQSLRTLAMGQAKNKAIILLTDGYHNAGKTSPKHAVAQAIKAGIKIYTIGIGKKSDYDVALLETIAQESHAKSYSASSASQLEAIYQEINTLEPSPIRSESYLNQRLLVSYPLGIVVILLSLWLWQERENTKETTTRVHWVVLILLAVALARPSLSHTLQNASIEGKEIIIALDVSYSMRATDIAPSRYDFGKETIKSLLQLNKGDNVMLLAFTSNPLLLSPPTTDHALITLALESLNPDFILTKGTSIQTLFERVATMKKGHKNLILLTDGGEEENLQKLKELKDNAHISLTILALGTSQGTTLTRENGTLLKDQEKYLVVSRLNPLLKSLSDDYLEASDSPQATALHLNTLLESHYLQTQKTEKIQRQSIELYQIPLSLAILLFLMVHTRGIKYLLILFAFVGLPAQASFWESYHLYSAYTSYAKADFTQTQSHLKAIETPSLQSQMLLANSYYKQGAYAKAITLYRSIASTSSVTKQQLYYNIANSYAMLQKYQKAKVYYAKALQLGEDADTKHNMALIALRQDKEDTSLGISHPKSQQSNSTPNSSQEQKERKNEEKPSSGSGGGGESKTKKAPTPQQLKSDETPPSHPLSSKVYELINQGYIYEKQPW